MNNLSASGNNVTFGDYIGWYEGLESLEIELLSNPPVFLKSAEEGEYGQSESNHAAQQFDKTMGFRRFSHLKLMISYMLGSGALASRYISYGCHCHLGPDVPRTTTRVKSIDSVDEVCRRQTMCMQCAKIDNGADCQGGVKGYSFHGEQDRQTGDRRIICDNTPGTCRHSLCLCDQALVEGFLQYENEWEEKNHHEWGNFNEKRTCSAAPAISSKSGPSATEFMMGENLVGSTGSIFGASPFGAYAEAPVQNDQTSAEEDSILLEHKSGDAKGTGYGQGMNYVGAAYPVYNAAPVSQNFESQLSFLALKKEEVPKGMQCCGEYPERFPYKPETGKACCGSTSYNTNIMECCKDKKLSTIGGC